MQKYTNKGSVPWYPKESRTPCKNALNNSTIANSISRWQGWHLFHCISPMSLQDGKKSLHTHTRFYTQTLLHADAIYTRRHAFTHKRFYTQTPLNTDTFTQTKASIAIFPQFLTSNVHFVRKGYDWPSKIAIFPHFLTSNVHFARKGYD